MHTPKNQCVSKLIAIKILTLAFALLLCLPAFFAQNVFCKLFFFGCHAVVANCAFARYCQTFVAFVT